MRSNGTKLKRVLLVESDVTTRLILLHLLRSVGFEVDFASNAGIASKRLRKNPDAILMELNIPGIQGGEFICEARRDPRFGTKPIYLFTCADFMSRAARELVAGEKTKLFDKLSFLPEKVVIQIASDLKGVRLNEEQHEAMSSNKKEFQASLKTRDNLKENLTEIHGALQALAKSATPEEWLTNCDELRRKVYDLLSFAAVARISNLARQAQVLETYLNQLCHEPKFLNHSCLETVSNSVEMLDVLSRCPVEEGGEITEYSAVIVDQSPASCTALEEAFHDAGFKPASFQEPAEAIKHLATHSAHLLVLNVRVPEMHGLDPKAIRALPGHSTTPVIQVPSPSDLNQPPDTPPMSAARMDANPIALTDLVLKALSLVQKRPATSMALAQATAPVSATQKTVAKKSSKDANSSREEGKSILFIEDDPVMRKVYKTRLEREGFRVKSAEDGLIALEMLPTVRPDLVVLDLMLPKLHGLEVLKFIRADVNLKATPVIVLSNVYMEGMATRAIKCGANLGMLKTQCTPGKLISAARELLGTSAASEAQPPAAAEPEPQASAEPVRAEDTTHESMQHDLLKDAPQLIAQLRQDCLNLVRTSGSEVHLDHLNSLYRNVRFLGARASLSGFASVAMAASALEALLFEIGFNYSPATPSALQSIAQAVDCLGRMFQNPVALRAPTNQKPKVLVVDDDAVCTTATVAALKRANFEACGVQDPKFALSRMQKTHFDLVLLDINMPGMNGFQVCEELRKLPDYKTTPVIFVTISTEFQDRARSILAGGNDLITKPVSPLELTLKSTMLLLDPSKQRTARPAAVADAPAVASPDAATNGREEIRAQDSRKVTPEASPDARPHAEVLANRTLQSAVSVEASTDGDSQASKTGVAPAAEAAARPPGGEVAAEQSPVDGVSRSGKSTDSEGDIAEVQLPLSQTASRPPHEELEKYRKERAELAARLYDAQVQLDHTRERVTRRDEALQQLQKQLDDLTAAKQELEKKLTEKAKNSEPSQKADEQARQGATEMARRIKELEDELSRNKTALAEAQAELAKQAAVRAQLDKDLHQHQAAAALTAQQVEVLQKEAKDRCVRLENDVVDLRQAREELNHKFEQELKAAAESGKRVNELESELRRSQTALEQTKAECEKQTSERTRLESELRQQLAATMSANQQLEAVRKESEARHRQLEQELATLRQDRDELTARQAQESQVTTDANRRIQELENELQRSKAEFERAQTETAQRSEERARLEEDLRKQLAAATAAAQQAEAAQQETQARCDQLGQDLGSLRQTHQELNLKFSQEQSSATDANRRIQELEKQLQQSAAEAEQARAELVRAQTEFAETSGKLSRHETDLQEKARTAAATAQQAKAALQQSQERCHQLEQDLAALNAAREELQAECAGERQAVAEAKKRVKELEIDLSHNQAALERAKAELSAQTLATQDAQTAHKESQERNRHLEADLAELRQTREELNAKCIQAQQAAAEAGRRVVDLENELGRIKAAFESVKTDLANQVSLAASNAAQAEAVHQQHQERERQLEQELAALHQAHEELRGQHAKQQKTAAESAQRAEALQATLGLANADLTALQSELAKQTAAAATASEQGETARHQCQLLERDLARLRQEHEELSAQYARQQQAAADSARRVTRLETELSERLSELEGTKSVLAKQVAQVDTAVQQADAARQQSEQRCKQIEQELAASLRSHQELAGKHAKAQQAASEAAQRVRELEAALRQSQSGLQRLEAELARQTAAAVKAAEEGEAAHKQTQERCAQLERDLVALRQARDELTSDYAREQQLTSEAGKRIQGLENDLGRAAEEVARAQTQVKEQTAECRRLESELHQQKEQASAAAQHAETAQKQIQERCRGLEQELAHQRQAREELEARCVREQGRVAEAGTRITELEKQLAQSEAAHRNEISKIEQQVHQGVEALGRVTAELEQERGGRQRAELRAKALTERLQELHEEMSRHLDAERARDGKILMLEEQLLQQKDTLARLASELKQESTERQLSEERGRAAEALNVELRQHLSDFDKARQVFKRTQAELESRLESSLNSLRAAEANLQPEARERQRLENALREAQNLLHEQTQIRDQQQSELQAAVQALHESQSQLRQETGERQRLVTALETAERALGDQSRRIEKLESQLRTALEALAQSKAAAQQEAAQHRQLVESLDAAQRQLRDQSECRELEVTRLRSELHLEGIERKRLQTSVAQLRHHALDAGRAARVLRRNLRKQIQKPIEDLSASSRRLLQLELSNEHKTLAENVLQAALRVQNCLQDTETPPNGTAGDR